MADLEPKKRLYPALTKDQCEIVKVYARMNKISDWDKAVVAAMTAPGWAHMFANAEVGVDPEPWVERSEEDASFPSVDVEHRVAFGPEVLPSVPTSYQRQGQQPRRMSRELAEQIIRFARERKINDWQKAKSQHEMQERLERPEPKVRYAREDRGSRGEAGDPRPMPSPHSYGSTYPYVENVAGGRGLEQKVGGLTVGELMNLWQASPPMRFLAELMRLYESIDPGAAQDILEAEATAAFAQTSEAGGGQPGQKITGPPPGPQLGPGPYLPREAPPHVTRSGAPVRRAQREK
jgi:hypothetical protein